MQKKMNFTENEELSVKIDKAIRKYANMDDREIFCMRDSEYSEIYKAPFIIPPGGFASILPEGPQYIPDDNSYSGFRQATVYG